MIDSFNFFDEETELKYSVSNLYDELQDRFRFLDRAKIKRSLIDEFGLSEQKKNRYFFNSLKRAEKTKEGNFFPESENNWHFIFKKDAFIKS